MVGVMRRELGMAGWARPTLFMPRNWIRVTIVTLLVQGVLAEPLISLRTAADTTLTTSRPAEVPPRYRLYQFGGAYMHCLSGCALVSMPLVGPPCQVVFHHHFRVSRNERSTRKPA